MTEELIMVYLVYVGDNLGMSSILQRLTINLNNFISNL